MIRPLSLSLVAAVCLALGCGPGTPSKPTPPEVSVVALESLAAVYRRNPADRTYKDRVVQVHLDAQAYRISPGRIDAYRINTGQPGAIVFEVAFTPADNRSPLVVTGTVRGIVRDGIVREPGVDYYVRVEGCTVTVLAR